MYSVYFQHLVCHIGFIFSPTLFIGTHEMMTFFLTGSILRFPVLMPKNEAYGNKIKNWKLKQSWKFV